MARRSDHTRAQLAALMIEAAGAIIAAEGVRGLTARKVAAAVGYSPGSIYNAVGDLDDLIVHVNGRTLDRLIEALSACPLTGDARADVMALVERYLAFEREHADLWAAIFDHVQPAGRPLPDWYHARIDVLLRTVQRALAPVFGPERPDGDHRDARHAVQVLWAGLHGITSLDRSGKLLLEDGDTPRAMARHLAESYLDGLIRQHRRPGG